MHVSRLITDTIGSFIVPEEFATLLGLVFSTIPQVKKGTDSRIGFGYRFGNHADTQVILELGPQVRGRQEPYGCARPVTQSFPFIVEKYAETGQHRWVILGQL